MKTYDDLYKESGFYWGTDPNFLCVKLLDLLPVESREGKRLIDLGCGEGRDLIRFAKNGFAATGTDSSKVGINKALKWAEKEGVELDVFQSDLRTYRLKDTFDVVYSSGTINILPPEIREEVFSNYKEHTAEGGINAFNAFVKKPFLEVPPDWSDDEHFFTSGELPAYYWDWETLYTAESIFDCNSSGKPHRHAMSTIISRKP